MPDRVHDVHVMLNATEPSRALRDATAAKLRVAPSELLDVEVVKRSLDARQRHPGPHWVFSVDAFRVGEEDALASYRADAALRILPEHRAFARPMSFHAPRMRPIVIGSGPAGLFAALAFAEHGVPCVLVERGKSLSLRHLDVRAFRRRGELAPDSNLCFGEGGAGTYSDGKLYTRKHHPLVRAVYERLVAFGATPDILTTAHPHIGTNKLYAILEGIRTQLLDRECEVRFGAKVVDLMIRDGFVRGVMLESGEELLGSPVVLAAGHSARDVYAMLHRRGVPLVQKPFAIGARAEHPQALIDDIQLGPTRSQTGVEPAEYFLACQVEGRGVYSFCMCPGGYIIPTPTELGHLNVNGMSNSNRGGDFANAAIVVAVEPRDFYIEKPGDLDHLGVLAGLEFQREWERRAFAAGGGAYRAPAQRLVDLAAGRPSSTLPSRTSYRPGLAASDLADVLPRSVISALRRGVRELDRAKMRGFLTEEAIFVGVETTTSSPIRVIRGEDRQSPGFTGLYPTGEGAGYSGGIVSSAIEGVETAWAALRAHV